MAVKPTAPRVMNGKWGMVYFDGEPVYETDSYEAKLKIEREDVDFVMQMAKDSKMTGLTGEWSMKVKKVFSRGAQLLSEKIKKGQDVRIQIRCVNCNRCCYVDELGQYLCLVQKCISSSR